MERPTRRRILAACAAGTVATLAGCGGGGTGEATTDGSGDSGGDGTGGSDGPEESDGSEDSANGTETADEGAAETADGGGMDGGASQFGEAVVFPDSFAMTATVSTGGETAELSGRFDGEDLYWEFEQQGQRIEWYIVDETSYIVTGGQCLEGSLQQGIDRDDVDPEGFSEDVSANPAIEPAGRDTIDGEEVVVYELSESATGDGTLTYYILVDSGYPRRIESDSMRWDFTSWGDVEPVEEPEMNCQPMPSGNPTPPGG